MCFLLRTLSGITIFAIASAVGVPALPPDCNNNGIDDITETALTFEERLVRQPTTLSLTWTAPSAPGGASLRYDLLRSDLADDFVSPAAERVESDGTDTVGVEPIPSGPVDML